MALVSDHSASPRSPRWLMPVIVGLLIFGIGLRFTNLDGKLFWNDEVITTLRTAGHTIWDFKGSYFDDRIIPFSDIQYFQEIKPGSSFKDTVDGLAVEDAKHTPLYFVLVRAWRLLMEQQFFQSPITCIRAASATLSLMSFPCLYLFCRELFPRNPAIAKIALGFFALSPVQLLYAQEARAYSLWTAAALLASFALLRAMRKPSLVSWGGYVWAATLGLYSQTLFTVVLLSHGVYVFIEGLTKSCSGQIRPKGWLGYPKLWWQYLGAITGLSILFIPWIDDILGTMKMLRANTGWVANAKPFSHLTHQWLVGLGSTFFDWDSLSLVRMMKGEAYGLIDYLPRFVVIAILLTAMAYVCYHAERSAWLLLLCIAAGPVVCLMLPDLIWGGQRSVSPRYWLASYCALQIAVAYCFGTKLSVLGSLSSKTLWKGLLFSIVTIQLISCICIIQAPIWWNKHFYNFSAVADVINAAPHPLVISDPTGANPGCIIALSYLVRPDVDLQLVTPPEIPSLPEGYDDIFFFDAYGEAYDSLAQLYQEKQGLEVIAHAEGILWKLTTRS